MLRIVLASSPPLFLLAFLVIPLGSEGSERSLGHQAHEPHETPRVEGTAQEFPADSSALLRKAESAIRSLISLQSNNGEPNFDIPVDSEHLDAYIHTMDSIAMVLPGHNWIVGHQVGLRVVNRQILSAFDVIRECEAEAWWCSMLTGYLLHLVQDFVGAEAAFDAAFAEMASDDRCRWMEEMADVGLLLGGDTGRAFGRASCPERIAMEDRIWWLSNPLYLKPGNDRKTEHLARAVAMHLHHEGVALFPDSFCSAHHAAEVKLGWERWDITYFSAAPAGWEGYAFVPGGSTGLRPLEAVASDWNLSQTFAPERYAPPYGPIHDLDHQTAAFLRGDSAIVVAGVELVGHPLEPVPILDRGLILARSEKDEPTIARGEALDDRFIFRATVPAERHLVGIEVLGANEAARTRFGYAPPTYFPGVIGMSDPLLFDWSEGLPEELDKVVPRALGTSRIAGNREIGVFWEIYGLESGDNIDISVAVGMTQSGIFGRLTSVLGLRRSSSPVIVEWEEHVTESDTTVLGRALHLGIGHLAPGEYTLQITTRKPGREEKTTSRKIQIIDA